MFVPVTAYLTPDTLQFCIQYQGDLFSRTLDPATRIDPM